MLYFKTRQGAEEQQQAWPSALPLLLRSRVYFHWQNRASFATIVEGDYGVEVVCGPFASDQALL